MTIPLKLLANRPKDQDDIRALCQRLRITSRQQGQDLLNRYIHQEIQQDYQVERKLQRLFPK